MPATIRIDFDVNAGGISEALKNELSKVQGIISSSNSAIEASRSASVKKSADEAIASANKTDDTIQKEKEKVDAYLLNLHKRSIADAEKAEVAAAKTAEKEREKTEKYLLGVRMNSIKAANSAEEKAEKERLAAIKKEDAERAHANAEHKNRIKEIVGVVAVAEGLNILVEKSKEAADYAVKMQTAFGSGEGLKAAKEDARKLGEQFGQTEMQAGATLAKIKAATASTGATQEEVIKLTQAATAMEAAGLPVSAKQLATEKGRQHILEVGGPLIANAMKAAQDPAKQAQLAIAQVQETIGEIAKVVLDALGPALKAVTPILGQMGEIIGTLIKPLFQALTPIIALIGKTLADLTPIITDLISSALAILTPIMSELGDILKELIPPIINVVKTIMNALQPVFKALMPIITEVAGIIKDIFMANAGMMVDMLQNVIVPLIRDLVAPILLSLMPVFKMLADMMRDIVVPAIKVLSGIMSFLMVNVVQPLIKWLSGGLVDAINAVVAVVTAAIKVVNAVVGAFKSLLGMGDDAAVAATKKTVVAVNAVEKDGQDASLAQVEEYHVKKEKKAKDHSDKIRKSYIQEQQDLIDLDEQTYAEAIAKLEIYYDKLAEANIKGRREVSNAIEKMKTAQFTLDKADEDRRLKEQELALVQEGLDDEDFKEAREAMEIIHLQKMKDIAEKNGQDVLDIQMSFINAQITQQKRLNKEKLDLAQKEKDDILAINQKISDAAEKDRKRDLAAIAQVNAARFAQINVAKDVYGGMANIAAQTQTANHNATALEKVDALAKAGFMIAEMVANILANSAELGPFGVLTAPATIAAGVAMFTAAKTTFGLKEGGFTGYGNSNDPSGHYTHKNEFVLKSGTFGVDSGGNLISVAGMGGGNAAVVHAIDRQTQALGQKMSESTVINQDRMVLENYRVERSRSRSAV